MGECSILKEQIPDLLVESLSPQARELAYSHLERCERCSSELDAYRTTWEHLGRLEQIELPERARVRFHDWIAAETQTSSAAPGGVLVFFNSGWLRHTVAKAAAVLLIVAGSFTAGHFFANRTSPGEQSGIPIATSQPTGGMILPASRVEPGAARPDFRNVAVIEGASGEIIVSFDVTSTMSIKGRPEDKNLVELLSQVLENESNPSHTRSRLIQWVKETYGESETVADPEIVRALVRVLANDEHEGVRIKAVDALRSLSVSALPEVQEALVKALKEDPNPAVRMKAVDALANLALTSGPADSRTLDILREKASDEGENTYIRVKASEALGQVSL
ncbi:MAG TPA: HEAT repeat domain-containing protein [Thermoanaerobaculia bacterium]|nr:HEAT repeat domain-containing protein [Thermoanaerobaculia bacterium]